MLLCRCCWWCLFGNLVICLFFLLRFEELIMYDLFIYDDVIVVVVWIVGYVNCMLVMFLCIFDEEFGVEVFFKCENL